MEGLFKEAADLVVWFVLVPLAWFIKRLVGRVDIVEKDISNHKTNVAETYLSKEDAREDFRLIHKKLDRIVDHLVMKRPE